MNALRKELPPLPPRIAALPIDDRGYPVPWFVAWIDGKPEFRVADGEKRVRAVNEKLCWVCGKKLGSYLAFLIGPMCAVNRISSEPPAHRECAIFSAIACPFLVRPHMKRRENDLPPEAGSPGVMIKRNPGVALVWITTGYRVRLQPEGFLIEVGPPREWFAFAEGRKATTEEIQESVLSGLPLLREIAEPQGPEAIRQLNDQAREAAQILGIEVPYDAPRANPSVFGGGRRSGRSLAALAAVAMLAAAPQKGPR